MRTLKPGLRDALRNNLGSGFDDLERSMEGPVPVSIRTNPAKPIDVVGDRVPWCSTGIYLPQRPSFTLDPRFHAGAYYVQEASSMLLEQCFGAAGFPPSPLAALDLCAAPGGKSTHLCSLLHPGSLLVSNEVERRRASILCENIWKWGATGTVITNDTPDRLGALVGTFHLVLVDAPCSGEGLIRKDDFAMEQWSPHLVQECAIRQRSIIDAVWPALKPGGVLIYSTCTYEPAENEEQVERIISLFGAEHLEVPLDAAWGMERGRGGAGIRCIPPRVRGEGLFMAALRKPGDRSAPDAGGTEQHPGPTGMHPFLSEEAAIQLTEQEGTLYATGQGTLPLVQRISAAVRTLAPGTPVAERKGHDWAPHAALALAPGLLERKTARLLLNEADALRFLRGEALSATGASGHMLATHNNLPLGWLKGAGNRWNNRWPSPWRIRMR